MTNRDYIGELILFEIPRFMRIFIKNLNPESLSGLKYQSIMIMWLLYREGEKRPTEIAETFRMSKGNVKYHLDKLEEKGYVKIRRLNKRKHIILLTAEGRKLMDRGILEAKKMISEILSRIPWEYLEDLKNILEKIKELNQKLAEVKDT